LKNAGAIDLQERDYFLKLDEPRWPPADLPLLRALPSSETLREGQWNGGQWQAESRDGGPSRFLHRTLGHAATSSRALSTMDEAILRFPSCPLFGTQRKQEYQFRLTPVNQHTFRLLRPAAQPVDAKIKRLFIVLNGLNEIDYLSFYYDLASLLLQDDSTACLIHPFPGHLTRYPMVGRYAEKPLNRFIGDPSDLFRQYLRYMVEIQWLLSALVPISSYPVTPGISLLEASDGPQGGRCDPRVLSQAIEQAWSSIYQDCAELAGYEHSSRGDIVHSEGIQDSIEALRMLLGWEASPQPLVSYGPDEILPEPALHIIGYSLGGYLAQSAFFTWPFAISSCTTLCSGGALNDLRPVDFAHEEEWRAVMHGLKYELDSGMLEQRIKIKATKMRSTSEVSESVAGIPADYFSSHFRMFNEVFLQDSHGSYRSRVSEFSPRLLFVVGGNDPIVTTRSVLESSPREGINMIEIANLGHFVATSSGEWRNFWLPAVSSLLFSFADRAATLLSKSVLKNLWNLSRTGPPDGTIWTAPDSRQLHGRESEALDSEHFQRELMAMAEPLTRSSGFLLILRNQIPTALMGPRLLHRRGTVPHYEDSRIREYWSWLTERRELILEHHRRVALVIPTKLREWFAGKPAVLSAKGEPSIRSIPQVQSLQSMWEEFLESWVPTRSLFSFNPEKPDGPIEGPSFRLERLVRERTGTKVPHPVLNCLPDVWIALSDKVIKGMVGSSGIDIHICFLEFIANAYQEQRGHGPNPNTANIEEWLAGGELKLIRVSGAEANSRFLGERVWGPGKALDLLVHSALALARSSQCLVPADFGGPDLVPEGILNGPGSLDGF
jgi:pimeloyl-ACP methyl ester carboxylesterase